MVSKVLFSSESGEWSTPQDFFDKLDSEFHFELDPSASEINHKCSLYFTKEQDALINKWPDKRVYCNPPYGRGVDRWVRKCSEHSTLAVMLLPARTDTKWFHQYIYNKPGVDIRFLQGRLKFSDKGTAPFPSMVVIFWNGCDH